MLVIINRMASGDEIGLGFRVPKVGKLHEEMTLDDFSKFDLWRSPYFMYPNVKVDVGGIAIEWVISIHPNASFKDGCLNEHISVTLNKCTELSQSLKMTAKIDAYIVGGCHLVLNYKKGNYIHFDLLISRNKLSNAHRPRDNITVVINADIVVTWAPYTNLRYDDYNALPNITIRCHNEKMNLPFGTARLHSNGAIVGWYSDVLKDACSKAMGRRSPREKCIDLMSNFSVVKCFLRLAHGEKLLRAELYAEAVGLLQLAFKHSIPLVRYLAENLLIEQLRSVRDANRCLRIGRMCRSERLTRASTEFLDYQRTISGNFSTKELTAMLLWEQPSDVCRVPVSTRRRLLKYFPGGSASDCSVRCVGASQRQSKRGRTDGSHNRTDDGRTISKEFKLHRNVICNRSNVFGAMFDSTGFEEAKTGIVNVQDISPDVMQLFVDLLYNRPVESDILDEYAEELLYASDKYLVTDVKELVVARLLRQIDVENCLRLFVLADRHSVTALKNACLEHICANWNAARNSENLRLLQWKLLVEVMDVLCQPRQAPV